MPEKMYTTGEAAKLLGVHVNTVNQWCKLGTITAHRTSTPSGHWRITRTALIEYAKLNGIPLEISSNE